MQAPALSYVTPEVKKEKYSLKFFVVTTNAE
jgi:hypothetical protein